MKINSKEYWDTRFDNDWLEFAGNKQTAFFATVLCEMLPKTVVKEIRANEYSVCDMGCALGDGIPIFSRKLAVDVDGMDFSPEAIKKARDNYPESHFFVGDLRKLDEVIRYDVVICSNVLEHFLNPWKIVKNLTEIANKYIIIMVPYKEQLSISEHMYHFTEEVIPIEIAGFTLNYVDTIDGNAYENSLYPDQQILMVYKKYDNSMKMLSELTQGIVDAVERNQKKQLDEKMKVLNDMLNEKECHTEELERQLAAKNDEQQKINRQFQDRIQELESLILVKNAEIQKVSQQFQEKNAEIQKVSQQFQEKNDAFQVKESQLQIAKQDIENAHEKMMICEQQVASLETTLFNARNLCYKINSKTSYKLLCAMIRFVKQFICGSMQEKKKFLGICKRCITRERSEFTKNDGYNVILNIANALELSQCHDISPVIENANNMSAYDSSKVEKTVTLEQTLNSITKGCLESKYEKADILIFSVINYDFRFQRPQHFASRFAQNGHRVFYINANFINADKISEIAQNLFVVDFFNDNCNAIYYAAQARGFQEWFENKMDLLIQQYAISDAIVILDYPHWIYGAEFLRKKYGYTITVDYMDDFTGFLGTTTNELKDTCIHMLESSDLVITSSQFLCDIAMNYAKKISIVRNGTEVNHFLTAAELERHSKRPVVGYYGAVAHWFAWEKVCYVAEKMPECDVVIIGEVTDHREELEKHKNIKLLGEMKYAELPKHLAYFDVCLIPFDTSTDLIKATNPVKFYEYLSAGKKIVATEIPELAPFKDEYVYMSNDNEKFLEYVKLCLQSKDSLRCKEECIAFARENDWQRRYENFAEACFNVVPKVSIIVLTYNNLELNQKCVDSILNKTAYPNYELIILDNCSTDGTVEYLHELEKKKNPKIKIIFNDVNSGFAGGNNKAIQESSGEFIMLLNNDTVVTRGWLTHAVKHMKNDIICGMCGAVTNSIGNEAMIAVNYTTLSELDVFAYQYTSMHLNELYTEVDRLAMFCTLIRKSIMDEYGMLDENYQVGMFEDDDYAQVVKKAGYKLYIAEDVFVHHVNNASFKKLESETYKKVFEKNKSYFEDKWSVKWKMPKYRTGVTATINQNMMSTPVQ